MKCIACKCTMCMWCGCFTAYKQGNHSTDGCCLIDTKDLADRAGGVATGHSVAQTHSTIIHAEATGLASAGGCLHSAVAQAMAQPSSSSKLMGVSQMGHVSLRSSLPSAAPGKR